VRIGTPAAKQLSFYVVVLAAFCSVLLISSRNELTFPYPWNDEARFFLPSWSFSTDGSLKPAILNAKDGIFWVPHGFYIMFGLLLRLFSPTIETARAISQVFVASAVSLALIANQRIARSRCFAACTAAVLISPPVILAANEVRMECVVVFLFALCVLFASVEQEILALSFALLSTLFHPALSIGLIFYCAFLIAKYYFFGQVSELRQESIALKITKYSLLTAVLAAVTLEAVFVVGHYSLFHSHMAYQASRKLGRSFVRLLLGKPQGVISLVETFFIIWSAYQAFTRERYRKCFYKELLPVLSLAFGLSLYGALGAEFQYDVYCLSFVPAIFASVAYRTIQFIRTDDTNLQDELA
jgi:hypothetical protein